MDARDCHPPWASGSSTGLHQVEIAINSSSLLGQSQTHRARGGEKFYYYGSEKCYYWAQFHFQNVGSYFEQRVDVCYVFNSLCTLTIQTRRGSDQKPGHGGEPCCASRVARQPRWPPTPAEAQWRANGGLHKPPTIPCQECPSSSDASGTLSKVSRESNRLLFSA